MPKYRCEILLEYTLNSGEGQIETIIASGADAAEAHQVAVNQYASNNPDDPSGTPFGTPVQI